MLPMPIPDIDIDKLIKAVIYVESRGDVNAISPVGAKGLMQLMDETGEEWHKNLEMEGPYNPYDERQNVAIGKAYILWLLSKFSGDIELALAAYNAGIGRIRGKLREHETNSFDGISNHLPSETQKYVPSVLQKYRKLLEV